MAILPFPITYGPTYGPTRLRTSVRYLRADLPWPAVVVLGFLISAALAALSYYTVERWAMRWRDARPAQRKPAPVRTARPATARGSLALSARGER